MSSYVCFVIVFWPELMISKARYSVIVLCLYYVCPWALLYCAIKSTYRSFQWRRMLNMRRENNNVIRLDGSRSAKPKCFSFLEALFTTLVLLATFALSQLMGGPDIWRGWL